MTEKTLRAPIHPGEYLVDELEALNMSPAEMAQQLHVAVLDVVNLIEKKVGLSAEMAMRLGHYFGTGPDIWMRLQDAYELDLVRQGMVEQLHDITPVKLNNPLGENHP